VKKYFIAGVLALSVFATAAFAADLALNDAVLQAGTDSDLTCAANASVDYTTQVNFSGEFGVTGIVVTFDPGCDGYYGYIAIMSAPGSIIGMGIEQIASNQVDFTVDPALGLVSNIEIVSVAVKSTDDSGGSGYYSGIITGS